MLKNSKEYLELKNKWKANWKKEIVDIVIFGSFVKNKLKPNDIDICIIFREKIEQTILKGIEAFLGEKHHVSSLVIDNFFTNPHSLSKTLLLEGKSLITGKSIADVFALTPKTLYSYDLSSEEGAKKVKFVYLLRGRNSSDGLVKEWKGEFISNSSFITPIEKDEEIMEVMNKWKIKYKRKKLLLMN